MVAVASRELWESNDDVTRTVEIIDTLLRQANRAVAAVRLLEQESARLFGAVDTRLRAGDGAGAPGPLHKTTVVIWSRFSGEEVELESLVRETTLRCGLLRALSQRAGGGPRARSRLGRD